MKNRFGKLNLSVAALAVMVLQVPALAGGTADITYGYDTNPFKLRDALDQRESGFLEADVKFQNRFESGFGFDIRGNFTFHSDADDADSQNLSGAITYKTKSSFLGKDAAFDARLRYTDLDRTYVSKTTGEIATSLGTPTPDRRDYQTLDGRARVQFDLSDTAKLRWGIDGRQRDYVDYTSLDLYNLDFSHWSTGVELTFEQSKASQIYFGLLYRIRDYDNREGRDLAGDPVVGSSLEYTFLEFEAGWEWEIAKSQEMHLSYGFTGREDNVSGYYDSTRHEFTVGYQCETQNQHQVSLQMQYLDYSYDNNVSDALLENEEPINSKDGYRFVAGYDHFLHEAGEAKFYLTTSVTYEDYDSVEANYIYDRSIAQIGVKASF